MSVGDLFAKKGRTLSDSPSSVVLYYPAAEMVYFMLDYLRCKSVVFSMFSLKVLVQVIDLNLLIPDAWSHTVQGEATLFCMIFACFLCNNRIYPSLSQALTSAAKRTDP